MQKSKIAATEATVNGEKCDNQTKKVSKAEYSGKFVSDASRQFFAAIPARAARMEKLNSVDLRVLIAIAAHAEMAGVSQICRVRHGTLLKSLYISPRVLRDTLERLKQFRLVAPVTLPNSKHDGFKLIYDAAIDCITTPVSEVSL